MEVVAKIQPPKVCFSEFQYITCQQGFVQFRFRDSIPWSEITFANQLRTSSSQERENRTYAAASDSMLRIIGLDSNHLSDSDGDSFVVCGYCGTTHYDILRKQLEIDICEKQTGRDCLYNYYLHKCSRVLDGKVSFSKNSAAHTVLKMLELPPAAGSISGKFSAHWALTGAGSPRLTVFS